MHTIVHSKKTEHSQQQVFGWYERRPLHDPDKVVRVLNKEEDDDLSAGS